MQNEQVTHGDSNCRSISTGVAASGERRARRFGMAAILVLAASSAAMFASTAAIAIEEKPGQEVCGPLDSGKIDTTGVTPTVTVTKGVGYLITGYCVKAGSDQSVVTGAVVYTTVDPAALSVTFAHPSGKSISHYSYSWTPACEYDPTIPASEEVCQQALAPKVTTSEWTDGTYECDDTTVVQTRTKKTTRYVYVNSEWVLDTAKAVVATETQTRGLSANEVKACPTIPSAPQVEVSSQSPAAAPPAAPAVVAATPIVTQLPSTGSSSWVTALIALVTLAGGTGLVRLSRRPTD